MKRWQFVSSLALGVTCVALAIFLVLQGNTNNQLQVELQKQQDAISRGSMSQQVGQNMLKDLAQLSVEDTEVKDLLTKHGFTVNVNTPTPTP